MIKLERSCPMCKENDRNNLCAGQSTVKLQGIHGHHKGTPVSDLRLGDVVVWNYGYTSIVSALKPVGTCFTDVFFDGKDKARRMKNTRLVVLKGDVK